MLLVFILFSPIPANSFFKETFKRFHLPALGDPAEFFGEAEGGGEGLGGLAVGGSVCYCLAAGFRPLGEGFGDGVAGGEGIVETGSKSTNQLLNKAWAIPSSVSFIRLFNSILSSNDPKTWAIAFCSGRGGALIAKSPI